MSRTLGSTDARKFFPELQGRLMRISTNVHAMVAKRHMQNAEEDVSRENGSMSSGSRINQAAYDPSGLAISETMRSRSRSMDASLRNINDGISLFQVSEGTLSVLQDMTGRMKELTLQTMTDTLNDDQRGMIDLEFQQIKLEMNKLTQSSKYNGNHILNGNADNYEIQVGIDGTKDFDRINYNMRRVLDSAGNFGMDNANLKTKDSARSTLSKVDSMGSKIAGGRSELGAVMNRFEHMTATGQVTRENLESAKSKIRDTDFAKVSAESAISKMKSGAAVGMLKIMNDNPGRVMKLLS